MTHKAIAAAALLGSAFALLPQGAAQARVVCDGEFQVSSGSAIATPLCQDRYLAEVARGYGMRVSATDVRNPGVKQEVCQFIGYDNRVYTMCSGWRNEPGGRFRR
jgi:hypothetical protein